jgi:esterase
MTAVSTGRVEFAPSGDVNLFVRRFGEPGETPMLILHGANYYDSRDWVRVAADLATDREVVAYDFRGYGLSSWSPNKDYSVDAHVADIGAVLHHLGWERAIFVGHSRGGSLSLHHAHASPERMAGLVLVDFSPGHVPGSSGVEPDHVGLWGPVYSSLEQAHAATSRNPHELDSESGRARVEVIFGQRDDGWVNVRRDPAFQNGQPHDKPDWASKFGSADLWESLGGLASRGTPVLVVRGSRSAVYDEAALSRMRLDYKPVDLVEVDSGHDVPGEVPGELVAAVSGFVS